MSILDAATPFGEEVGKRLAVESVIWLTTVGANTTPQPNPVWFHWENDEFLIFTMPEAKRLRHIAENPRVSLNFNSTDSGGEVAVFTGTARVGEAPTEAEIAHYVRKYTKGFVSIKMTESEFFEAYSVPIRVTPERLRGF
ncbi:TIGR03667 family PPOX class F420-dependent oxidoreductase [Nocardia sp. NPDC058519]|uniref:TIGR03667 family PPOX class F420-dependent oxidoreductase n=1 Tax=Nocardia sp. NPDC058519 TaxID=3346535 RepID=UPI00364DAC4C